MTGRYGAVSSIRSASVFGVCGGMLPRAAKPLGLVWGGWGDGDMCLVLLSLSTYIITDSRSNVNGFG